MGKICCHITSFHWGWHMSVCYQWLVSPENWIFKNIFLKKLEFLILLVYCSVSEQNFPWNHWKSKVRMMLEDQQVSIWQDFVEFVQCFCFKTDHFMTISDIEWINFYIRILHTLTILMGLRSSPVCRPHPRRNGGSSSNSSISTSSSTTSPSQHTHITKRYHQYIFIRW